MTLTELTRRLLRRRRTAPIEPPPARATGRHRATTPLAAAVQRHLDDAPTRALSRAAIRAAIADPPPTGHWASPVDERWAAATSDEHELVRGHVRELHRMQGGW